MYVHIYIYIYIYTSRSLSLYLSISLSIYLYLSLSLVVVTVCRSPERHSKVKTHNQNNNNNTNNTNNTRFTYGFYHHFNNLYFNNRLNISDILFPFQVFSSLQSIFLRCRLLKWFLAHPTKGTVVAGSTHHLSLSIYVYIYIHVCMYIYVYIYIYIYTPYKHSFNVHNDNDTTKQSTNSSRYNRGWKYHRELKAWFVLQQQAATSSSEPRSQGSLGRQDSQGRLFLYCSCCELIRTCHMCKAVCFLVIE